MAIVKNSKMNEINTKDNKTLASANKKTTAPLKTNNIQKGRPKKFKDEMVSKVMIGFTQNQLNLIDQRAKQLGITVRLDYIRKLIADDIEGFNG